MNDILTQSPNRLAGQDRSLSISPVSESCYRSLFENTVFGVFRTTADAIIRAANPALARILGYASESDLLREAVEIGPRLYLRADDWLKVRRELEQHDAVLDFEFEARRKDGTAVSLVQHTFAVRGDRGTFLGYEGSLEDISHLKQRMARSCQVQQLNTLGRMSADVAHYLGNALSVIQGHAALLRGDPALPETAADSVRQIALTAGRLSHLTHQLLAISSQQEIRLERLKLDELIARLSRRLRESLGPENVLQIHSSAGLPWILADSRQLEQLLSELVHNARDAMTGGGQLVIHTSTTVIDEVSAKENPDASPGEFVCLRLSDTGCGIPADILERVFQPFVTTKGLGLGTGLGLPTVYGLVKQHNGWIQLTSEVGRGTTILIFLPIADDQSVTPSDKSVPHKTIDRPVVLVAEDDRALLELARRALERFGYEVLTAVSGHAAMELWQEHKNRIQLLLTDLVMPDGLTGEELAERLREEAPHLKIIYSSGYPASQFGKNLGLIEGVNFLQKPLNIEKLVDAVHHAIHPLQ